MDYKIKGIYLKEKGFDEYIVKDKINKKELDLIDNLSKVNLFVGPNNSGKSRFVRKIINSNPFYYIPKKDSDSNEREINYLKERHFKNIISFFNYIRKHLVSRNEFSLEIKRIDEIIQMIESFNSFNCSNNNYKEKYELSLKALYSFDLSFINKLNLKNEFEQIINSMKLKNELDDMLNELKKDLNNRRFQLLDFKLIFIPTLRNLRLINKDTDLLKERTIEDYKLSENNCSVFTGQKLYDEIDSLIRGSHEDRNRLRKYEEYLSSNFFENREVTLIPKKGDEVLWVKIGSDEKPIYNLGDGIQSIIILTFPIFKYSEDNLILAIEEPELFLHPYLQRKYLEILSKSGNSHQYFIATHSNHLLDMTLDFNSISVYSFEKKFKSNNSYFEITNVDNDDIRILENLGVKNSSVFLTNCTIWVEGITDRKYIRKYLELYQNTLSDETKKYEEDKHFSFVEYSGNNITHWSFLDPDNGMDPKKLCGKLLLITDNDNPKKRSKKYERQDKLKEILREEQYICLEAKEIENLLSPNTIRKIIEEVEGLDENSDFKIKKFKDNNYRNKGLGKYIEEILLKDKQNKKWIWKNSSGGINYKNKFCESALNYLESYDDLTDETKLITEKIYNFIKQNNQ